MKKLSVFDPAMCCSTGVCGPDPDQALIDFASDFDWLKAHGVPAERWNLANQPMAFVLNHKASAFLRAKGSDALPLILVDNEERLSGRYPSRSELSEWFGIPMTACERARELEKSTGISAEAVCGPECGCGESPKASSQSTLKDTVSGLKFLENAPHTLFFIHREGRRRKDLRRGRGRCCPRGTRKTGAPRQHGSRVQRLPGIRSADRESGDRDPICPGALRD